MPGLDAGAFVDAGPADLLRPSVHHLHLPVGINLLPEVSSLAALFMQLEPIIYPVEKERHQL